LLMYHDFLSPINNTPKVGRCLSLIVAKLRVVVVKMRKGVPHGGCFISEFGQGRAWMTGIALRKNYQ
jgi:hypothetical protein